jgi:hypothetical protein
MTGDLFGADPLCAYEPESQSTFPPATRMKEADT